MEKAIAAYHRAAAAARDTSEGRLLRGRALLLEDKIEEAEQVLRRLIAVDRNNSKPEAARADVLAMQEKFAEAVMHYNRALAIAFPAPRARRRPGLCRRRYPEKHEFATAYTPWQSDWRGPASPCIGRRGSRRDCQIYRQCFTCRSHTLGVG